VIAHLFSAPISLHAATGITTLIGPRRLLAGAKIAALAVLLAIMVFVGAVPGRIIYRLDGR
jgi:hypothetical protein